VTLAKAPRTGVRIVDFVLVLGICNAHKAASLPCCCVKKIPCDVTTVVNADGMSSRSVRNIENGDVSLVIPQEIVVSSSITEISRDFIRIVDGSRHAIEDGYIPLRIPQKAARRVRLQVIKIPCDISPVVDADRIRCYRGISDVENSHEALPISYKSLPARIKRASDTHNVASLINTCWHGSMDNRREGRYIALSVPHKTYPGVASYTRNDKARDIAAIVNRHRKTYGRYCWGRLGDIEYCYVPLRVP